MVVSFAISAGWAERVWGTRRAALAVTGLQVTVVVMTAGLLTVLSDAGLPWAVELAGKLDVGFSAGALDVLAVLCGRVRAPLRTWLRLALVLYVVVSLVVVGGLADVEHSVAVSGGLVFGLIRDRRPPSP